MRVYLDCCSIQRPLDIQSQTRIRLKSEAILGVIAECEAKRLELVSSEPPDLEVADNPLALRREYAESVLEKTSIYVRLADRIKRQARSLVQNGIKPVDALHLASAEAANCDYFCTCDDRFLRRAKIIQGLKAQIVSPLELVETLKTRPKSYCITQQIWHANDFTPEL